MEQKITRSALLQVEQKFTVIRAMCPSGLGQCEFFIPIKDVEHWCKCNINRYYDLQSVIDLLPTPSAIFEDLKRNGYEHGFCYSGRPKQYQQQSESLAPPGIVFAVYADKNRVVFDYGWEREDKKYAGMPEKAKTRFGKLLWKL